MKVLIDDIADVINNHFPLGPKGEKDCYYMEDAGDVWGEESDGGLFDIDKDGKYKPFTPGEMVVLDDFNFFIAWQGHGDEVPARPDNFSALFRKVMKAKTSIRVMVEIPKDELKSFEASIKKMGKGYKLVKGD